MKRKRKLKRKLKLDDDIKITSPSKRMKRYNEEFIDALNELEDIMLKKGEPFRAKAYRSASESIITYEKDIHSASDLSDTPKIGPTIISKLNEYVETGKIKLLEDERNNPAENRCDCCLFPCRPLHGGQSCPLLAAGATSDASEVVPPRPIP